MARPKRNRPSSRPAPAPPAPFIATDEQVWWRDPVLWALAAIAAVLLLANLGGRCLWQDEAETALLGRNILHFGQPVAFDGVNVVSQEAGHEFGPDHVWRWSPWVQFYLAAGGMKLFGDSTSGARLPFALLAILVVPLTYVLARAAYASTAVARFAALALATSVWFLLHARQARWHAPAYVLACVVLLAVFRIAEGKRVWTATLAVAGAALFYTNYFVAICFLVGIAVASPLLARDRRFLIDLASGIAGAAILSLPGVVYFHVLGKAGGGQSSAWTQFRTYVVQYLTYLLPLPLAVVVLWRDRARPATRFLLAMSLATCVVLAFAPWTMFRYVTILFPAAALLIGVSLAVLLQSHRVAGWIAVALLVLTSILHRLPLGYMDVHGTKEADPRLSPIAAYVGELVAPPAEPECAVAGFLQQNARPSDTVMASYGDLVLQFYTRMHVTGGMEGQPLPLAPDWVIGRSFIRSTEPGKDFRVVRWFNTQVDRTRYELAATLPDATIPGSADPEFHTFRDKPDPAPLRILKRVR